MWSPAARARTDVTGLFRVDGRSLSTTDLSSFATMTNSKTSKPDQHAGLSASPDGVTAVPGERCEVGRSRVQPEGAACQFRVLLGHPRQLRRRLTPGKLTAAFAGQLADDAAKIIEVAGQTTHGVRHHDVQPDTFGGGGHHHRATSRLHPGEHPGPEHRPPARRDRRRSHVHRHCVGQGREPPAAGGPAWFRPRGGHQQRAVEHDHEDAPFAGAGFLRRRVAPGCWWGAIPTGALCLRRTVLGVALAQRRGCRRPQGR